MNAADAVTVYGPGFSVPGQVIERSVNIIRIDYPAPAGPRQDWFHILGAHAGKRLGDRDDQPVRFRHQPEDDQQLSLALPLPDQARKGKQ